MPCVVRGQNHDSQQPLRAPLSVAEESRGVPVPGARETPGKGWGRAVPGETGRGGPRKRGVEARGSLGSPALKAAGPPGWDLPGTPVALTRPQQPCCVLPHTSASLVQGMSIRTSHSPLHSLEMFHLPRFPSLRVTPPQRSRSHLSPDTAKDPELLE